MTLDLTVAITPTLNTPVLTARVVHSRGRFLSSPFASFLLVIGVEAHSIVAQHALPFHQSKEDRNDLLLISGSARLLTSHRARTCGYGSVEAVASRLDERSADHRVFGFCRLNRKSSAPLPKGAAWGARLSVHVSPCLCSSAANGEARTLEAKAGAGSSWYISVRGGWRGLLWSRVRVLSTPFVLIFILGCWRVSYTRTGRGAQGIAKAVSIDRSVVRAVLVMIGKGNGFLGAQRGSFFSSTVRT